MSPWIKYYFFIPSFFVVEPNDGAMECTYIPFMYKCVQCTSTDFPCISSHSFHYLDGVKHVKFKECMAHRQSECKNSHLTKTYTNPYQEFIFLPMFNAQCWNCEKKKKENENKELSVSFQLHLLKGTQKLKNIYSCVLGTGYRDVTEKEKTFLFFEEWEFLLFAISLRHVNQDIRHFDHRNVVVLMLV